MTHSNSHRKALADRLAVVVPHPDGNYVSSSLAIKEAVAILRECSSGPNREAERYRWLNKQHNFMVYIESALGLRQNVRLRCGVPLDEWIDARIKEEWSSATPQRTEEA